VRKKPFGRQFYAEKRSNYQDRLGMNIGTVQKQEAFCAERTHVPKTRSRNNVKPTAAPGAEPQVAKSYSGASGDKVPVTGMCLGCVNGRNVGEIASLHAHNRPHLTQVFPENASFCVTISY
jgi:hypothetical protein